MGVFSSGIIISIRGGNATAKSAGMRREARRGADENLFYLHFAPRSVSGGGEDGAEIFSCGVGKMIDS